MRPDASNEFSVAVLCAPVSGWAQVLLSGDVDEAAAEELTTVIDKLASTPVRVVYIDVAAVTFADSTLVDFCALLRATVPARTALVVCRPLPMTRSILEESRTRRTLTLRDDLPLLDASRATPFPRSHRRTNSLKAAVPEPSVS
jgi:anti-anti-sigma regulatory factor